MRSVPEHPSVSNRECSDRRVCLRAVDEGDALLRTEDQWSQSRLGKNAGCGAPRFRPKQIAFAQQSEREVRERREVSARTDGALLRDGGPQVRVEHTAQQLRHSSTRPREALCKHVGAEEHHRPNLALWKQRPNTCGMAAHKIGLKICEPLV